MHAWDAPRLNIACGRLTIFKPTDDLQRKIPRIGNYCERANVRSGHSRDAASYKITLIIIVNSQFTELLSCEIAILCSMEITKPRLGLGRF